MNVVYFGTPAFAADVLQFLLNNGINITHVVSKPDRPQGRSGTAIPTPVKQVALAQPKPIAIFQPEKVSSSDCLPVLESFNSDLFVVVAYGEIIKQQVLEMPKLGCINLHASLLPKYRGAAPIQRSILAGEAETGVTIIHMAKKMDAGDMIKTVTVPISPEATFGEVERSLCSAGSLALLETIRDFEQGIITRIPQDDSFATFAPKIELEECEIHWNENAQKIHNLVRGVNPHPGAWCWVKVKGQKKRLKIKRTRPGHPSEGFPGKVVLWGNEGIAIHCKESSLLLLELQLEGKKSMSGSEFSRGLTLESIEFL